MEGESRVQTLCSKDVVHSGGMSSLLAVSMTCVEETPVVY